MKYYSKKKINIRRKKSKLRKKKIIKGGTIEDLQIIAYDYAFSNINQEQINTFMRNISVIPEPGFFNDLQKCKLNSFLLYYKLSNGQTEFNEIEQECLELYKQYIIDSQVLSYPTLPENLQDIIDKNNEIEKEVLNKKKEYYESKIININYLNYILSNKLALPNVQKALPDEGFYNNTQQTVSGPSNMNPIFFDNMLVMFYYEATKILNEAIPDSYLEMDDFYKMIILAFRDTSQAIFVLSLNLDNDNKLIQAFDIYFGNFAEHIKSVFTNEDPITRMQQIFLRLQHFDRLSFILLFLITEQILKTDNAISFFTLIDYVYYELNSIGIQIITLDEVIEFIERQFNKESFLQYSNGESIAKDDFYDSLQKLEKTEFEKNFELTSNMEQFIDIFNVQKVINDVKMRSIQLGRGRKNRKYKTKKKKRGGNVNYNTLLKQMAESIGSGLLKDTNFSDIHIDGAHDELTLKPPGTSFSGSNWETTACMASDNFNIFKKNARLIFYDDTNTLATLDSLNESETAMESQQNFINIMNEQSKNGTGTHVLLDAGKCKFLRKHRFNEQLIQNKYPVDIDTIQNICAFGDDIRGDSTKHLSNHFDSATTGSGNGFVACFNYLIQRLGINDANPQNVLFNNFWQYCIYFLSKLNIINDNNFQTAEIYKSCLNILNSFKFEPQLKSKLKFTVGLSQTRHLWNDVSQSNLSTCIKAVNINSIAKGRTKGKLPSFYKDISDLVDTSSQVDRENIKIGVFRLMKYIGDKSFFIDTILKSPIENKQLIVSLDKLASVNTYNDLYDFFVKKYLTEKIGIIHVGPGNGKATRLMQETDIYKKIFTEAKINLDKYNIAAYVIDSEPNSKEKNELKDILNTVKTLPGLDTQTVEYDNFEKKINQLITNLNDREYNTVEYKDFKDNPNIKIVYNYCKFYQKNVIVYKKYEMLINLLRKYVFGRPKLFVGQGRRENIKTLNIYYKDSFSVMSTLPLVVSTHKIPILGEYAKIFEIGDYLYNYIRNPDLKKIIFEMATIFVNRTYFINENFVSRVTMEITKADFDQWNDQNNINKSELEKVYKQLFKLIQYTEEAQIKVAENNRAYYVSELISIYEYSLNIIKKAMEIEGKEFNFFTWPNNPPDQEKFPDQFYINDLEINELDINVIFEDYFTNNNLDTTLGQNIFELVSTTNINRAILDGTPFDGGPRITQYFVQALQELQPQPQVQPRRSQRLKRRRDVENDMGKNNIIN